MWKDVEIIFPCYRGDTEFNSPFSKPVVGAIFDLLLQLGRPTAANAPRVLVEIGTWGVGDTYPFALAPWLVYLTANGLPDEPSRRVGGRERFTVDAEHRADGATHGRLILSEENDGGRAVTRNVCA